MTRRIVLVQGHPDKSPDRFCRALAGSYLQGARDAGHQTRLIDIASLDFKFLSSQQEWDLPAKSPDIVEAQRAIADADHVVFVFPLWLGTLPALLKAFLEQVLRPNFAFDGTKGSLNASLTGRSSRIIVTMGMPAWIYRGWYGARGVKGFDKSILRFVGIKPNRITLIGSIGNASEAKLKFWLEAVAALGRDCR